MTVRPSPLSRAQLISSESLEPLGHAAFPMAQGHILDIHGELAMRYPGMPCAQPGRHPGLALATTNAQFGNVIGHSECGIRNYYWQPPIQYAGQFLATARARSGSVMCNKQSISRKYC